MEQKKRVEPSAEMLGFPSKYKPLTGGPRFTGTDHSAFVVSRVVTHMSQLPDPPGRFEWKKSIRPSAEMFGVASADGLLTVGPRFTGVLHGSLVVARVVTHMSSFPDRLDIKKSSRPSAEMLWDQSIDELLTVGPRLTGVVQSPSAMFRLVIHRS